MNQVKRVEAPFRETSYLKLFRQKNSTHEGQREKAQSLIENLTPFDLRTFLRACHFNHRERETKDVEYREEDMI